MKPPRLFISAVVLGFGIALVGAVPAAAQDKGELSGAYDEFFGAAGGILHSPSFTGALISGWFVHYFGRVTLGPPMPSPERSFSTNSSTTRSASNVRIVPGLAGEVAFIPSQSTVTFMGGPRVMVVASNSRVAPYGEFLFGALHFSGDFSGTDKLMMPAAGVVIAIPNTKLKITGEIGWPIDFFDGFHETDTRFQFGVMLPIGAAK